jgi:hypothetical protein
MRSKVFALTLLLAVTASAAVPRDDCFPLEQLPAEEQTASRELLWKLLDSEALFTVVGPLKPVSEGFWRGEVPAEGPWPEKARQVERQLRTFSCGQTLETGLLVFHSTSSDKNRLASAFVAHRGAVRATLARHPRAFAAVGVRADMSVREMLERVDRAAAPDRWRAFGLLFGYPPDAVEFFVAAGEEQQRTGKFVKREFRNLSTFASDRGRFVYAVPVGHKETAYDRYLKEQSARILAEYRRRRAIYRDPKNGAGPAFLVRDWYDGGHRVCDPSHASADPPWPEAKAATSGVCP